MIEIIPAIDIIEGKCVRLTQGDYRQVTVYENDPVVVARRFEAAGIKRLHLVDLDGARYGSTKNIAVLEKIAKATRLNIDFSGGVRSYDACRRVIGAGATFISLGSMAVRQPDEVKKWMQQLGYERFIIGVDVKDRHIAVNGWQEQTAINISDFIIDYYKTGIRTFFCTDIAKDGMLQGPAIDLYQEILQQFNNIKLIASGGIASKEDIKLLAEAGCSGVIIGKAFYEGKITIDELC